MVNNEDKESLRKIYTTAKLFVHIAIILILSGLSLLIIGLIISKSVLSILGGAVLLMAIILLILARNSEKIYSKRINDIHKKYYQWVVCEFVELTNKMFVFLLKNKRMEIKHIINNYIDNELCHLTRNKILDLVRNKKDDLYILNISQKFYNDRMIQIDAIYKNIIKEKYPELSNKEISKILRKVKGVKQFHECFDKCLDIYDDNISEKQAISNDNNDDLINRNYMKVYMAEKIMLYALTQTKGYSKKQKEYLKSIIDKTITNNVIKIYISDENCPLHNIFYIEVNDEKFDSIMNNHEGLPCDLVGVTGNSFEIVDQYLIAINCKAVISNDERKINKETYKRESNDNNIHVIAVKFDFGRSGRTYYLGDNNLYNIGDRVVVPTVSNGVQTATVVFKKVYKKGESVPYDPSNIKKVIGKN